MLHKCQNNRSVASSVYLYSRRSSRVDPLTLNDLSWFSFHTWQTAVHMALMNIHVYA